MYDSMLQMQLICRNVNLSHIHSELEVKKMPAGGKRSLDLSLVSSASKRRRSDKRKGEISRFFGVLRTDYQCRGFGSALALLDPDPSGSENADP